MSMSMTDTLISGLPQELRESQKVAAAIERGRQHGVDHLAFIDVSAAAGVLDRQAMSGALSAWVQVLRKNAATLPLAGTLEQYSGQLAGLGATKIVAKALAMMAMLEKRLIDNCGLLSPATLEALFASWELELMRAVGTEQQFQLAHRAMEVAWAKVEEELEEDDETQEP